MVLSPAEQGDEATYSSTDPVGSCRRSGWGWPGPVLSQFRLAGADDMSMEENGERGDSPVNKGGGGRVAEWYEHELLKLASLALRAW